MFRHCRAMVVTHIHAKNQGLKSVGSKSRKKTDTTNRTTFLANAAGKNREYPLTDVEETAFVKIYYSIRKYTTKHKNK